MKNLLCLDIKRRRILDGMRFLSAYLSKARDYKEPLAGTEMTHSIQSEDAACETCVFDFFAANPGVASDEENKSLAWTGQGCTIHV